jgi:hypothetical protein
MRLIQPFGPTPWLGVLLLAACTATPDGVPAVDAVVGGDSGAGADAMPGDDAAVRWPTWTLEDIQPASPRVGQTYGLDTFSGKVVVVSLLEGF